MSLVRPKNIELVSVLWVVLAYLAGYEKINYRIPLNFKNKNKIKNIAQTWRTEWETD